MVPLLPYMPPVPPECTWGVGDSCVVAARLPRFRQACRCSRVSLPAPVLVQVNPRAAHGAGLFSCYGNLQVSHQGKVAPFHQLVVWQNGGVILPGLEPSPGWLAVFSAAANCLLIACPFLRQGRGQAVNYWAPPRAEVAQGIVVSGWRSRPCSSPARGARLHAGSCSWAFFQINSCPWLLTLLTSAYISVIQIIVWLKELNLF